MAKLDNNKEGDEDEGYAKGPRRVIGYGCSSSFELKSSKNEPKSYVGQGRSQG